MSALRVRTRRHSTSKAAVIACDGHAVECTVANTSVGGARLLVRDAGAVPNRFELQTKPADSVYQCRTVWREEGEVGVEFVDGT
ncbi:PilZ domain-containing protein [Methylobacterium sp. A49B]